MPADSGQRDRTKITLLMILWFSLAIFAVLWGVPRIEGDLTIRAEEALGESSVDVRLSGRDATLIASGSAESAEAARQAVLSVDGIRTASVDVVASALEEVIVNPSTERAPPEPELADPSITLRASRGTFSLIGSVVDEATVQALTAAAFAGFDEDRVTVDMNVDPDTLSPGWLSDPFPIFAAIGPYELGMEIYEKIVRITGAVVDETTRNEVVSAIEAHLGDSLTVVDRLIVVPPEELVFSMTASGGSVTLRGTLPSQGEVNTIQAAAEKIYGEDSVATWLTVDTVAPGIPYLTDSESFFRAFEGRTLDFIDNGDALIVRGTVPSEGIRTSIAEALTAVVDPRGLNNELEVIEVDEETAAAIDAINDIIGTSLNFDSGSNALSEADQAKLDEVAEILDDNPTLRAVIEGHTDDRGVLQGNLRLSEERAGAVVTYLVSVGIDPDRLSTIGFGVERPIASNDTSAGRGQNRRIEFNVEGSA